MSFQEFWRSLGRAPINLRRCPVRPDTDHLCATAANVGHEETHALQQTAALFDHVVGNGEQSERHRDAERARRFHADDELEILSTVALAGRRACFAVTSLRKELMPVARGACNASRTCKPDYSSVASAAISPSGSRCTGVQPNSRRAFSPLSCWSIARPRAQSPSSAAMASAETVCGA